MKTGNRLPFAVAALVALGMLFAALPEPASAGASIHTRCRAAIAKQTRRYLERVQQSRQRCLRRVFSGKSSPLTNCIHGVVEPQDASELLLGDTAIRRRIERAQGRIRTGVAKRCTGIDLTPLGFPGPCPSTDTQFDLGDLETCMIERLDGRIRSAVAMEFPPESMLPPRVRSCVAAVGRHGGAMLRIETRAREKCLLDEELSLGFEEPPALCREQLPPYGVGTGRETTDRKVRRAWVELLAGIPGACSAINVDKLGYIDDCEDRTGGRFSLFDLRLCLFDDHRDAVRTIVTTAFPVPPQCGDGEITPDEECDDGNDVDTDACLNDCTVARCGDGVTRADVEECDDGNTSQNDACLNDCKNARCGDGEVHIGVEQCDDGNDVQTDACLAGCVAAACGDGIRCEAIGCTTGAGGGTEACDDGNSVDGDGCSGACEIEFCGDGVIQTDLGEECDDGSANSNTQPNACRGNCKLAHCGDNVVDDGETCDPPDQTTCSDQCANLTCGNGQLEEGEECDNGTANSDTAPDACRRSCRFPSCGDGVADPGRGEACDDGNTEQGDACRNDCQANVCGDGFTNPAAEECDDGNTSDQDPCRNDCRNNVCGDGFLNGGIEDCDDGNSVDTDRCLNDCTLARCGDGVVCSGPSCVSGPLGGPEECDAGAGNSDTTTDACRTTCALAACGDGVVDTGEDCDGTAGGCEGGASCGDSCLCANECPGSGELIVLAAAGPKCTTNDQCLAGECRDGRCRTGSRLDTGATGIAHNADITDAVVARGFLECGGTFPCGVCTLEGLDPSNRSCRCANNNRTICNQPFESDPACSTPSCTQADSPDLIGISCSTNSDCGPQLGRCNFDDTCACYFGPPLALSAGNTPACVVNRFSEDIVGTANVDLGQGEITTKLRSVVFTGEALTIPCPHCEGDVTPNDGVRDGVCVLGDNAGKTCDVDAVNTTFPAPEGGGHSLDCFPAFGRNVSGSGLRIELTQTTGSSELKKSGDVVCGFPPFLPKSCWCAQCSGDPSVSCTSTAECEAAGLGTCTSFGSGSRPPAPNACDEDKCVAIAGSAEFGECELGPTDKFCDGIVRASGVGYVGCQGDADCSINNIGLDAGFCTLSVRRACFLDPIIVSGEPDPSTPIGATTFCIPPTANRAINEVAGLPGPARVRTQARSRLFCANDPNKEYTPGVGGCE